jgi:hypothetical protein
MLGIDVPSSHSTSPVNDDERAQNESSKGSDEELDLEQDNEEEGMKQQAHRTQPMSHKLLQNAN